MPCSAAEESDLVLGVGFVRQLLATLQKTPCEGVSSAFKLGNRSVQIWAERVVDCVLLNLIRTHEVRAQH